MVTFLSGTNPVTQYQQSWRRVIAFFMMELNPLHYFGKGLSVVITSDMVMVE